MRKEFIDLAKYRFEKASNTLSDAKTFFPQTKAIESTVNRIYYAMFYAVNALLILKGLSSAKHSGIRAIFNREIIKTGIIDPEQGKFYSEMYNNRQEGDYKDFVTFNRDEVEIWLQKAEIFINRVADVIQDLIKE